MSGELPVRAHCLPFSQIPHTTWLFADFLAYSPKVQQFYPCSPNLNDWAIDQNPNSRFSAGRRQQVTAILERQNRSWGASAATLSNLERLRAGAAAIVTGQQVGLFGGPAFALYKALMAVRLAEQASKAGVPTVPVFWLATNDHDLAEVNHVWLSGLDGVPQLFTSESKGVESAPVGNVVFDPEIEPIVQQATDLLGDSEVADFLRSSYRVGETYGSAFAKLMARLFSDIGVILLDPMDPAFGTIAEPIYRAAIEQAGELDEKLLARGKELETAGYHQQVKVTASSTLLFAIQNGARVPVHRRPNGNGADFSIGVEKLSRAELLGRIAARPQDFNPNVLLRPIVQDYLLPTLAYTGGSAEVSYFAQVGVVYEALLGRTTPVVPRFSATLIEPKEDRLLEKYRLKLTDLFHGPEALQERVAAQTLPRELKQSFEQAHVALESALAEVNRSLQRLDPTLVESSKNAESKMRYQLNRLQSRAARAQLRHDELIGRHVTQLSNALFPHKELQEREFGGVSYLARHGTEFLRDIHGLIHTDCHDHQVVTLD
jgi:bacillithiol biosynthesis cysteine-adding enzyme BshC